MEDWRITTALTVERLGIGRWQHTALKVLKTTWFELRGSNTSGFVFFEKYSTVL